MAILWESYMLPLHHRGSTLWRMPVEHYLTIKLSMSTWNKTRLRITLLKLLKSSTFWRLIFWKVYSHVHSFQCYTYVSRVFQTCVKIQYLLVDSKKFIETDNHNTHKKIVKSSRRQLSHRNDPPPPPRQHLHPTQENTQQAPAPLHCHHGSTAWALPCQLHHLAYPILPFHPPHTSFSFLRFPRALLCCQGRVRVHASRTSSTGAWWKREEGQDSSNRTLQAIPLDSAWR